MKRTANAVTSESRTVLRLAFRVSRLYMASDAAPTPLKSRIDFDVGRFRLCILIHP